MNKPDQRSNIRFAFFGTSHVAVYVLEELHKAGFVPSLIVTMPDRPHGRGMELKSPAVKVWALKHGIEVVQPEKLHSNVLQNIRTLSLDVAVVCDYGKILSRELLEIPAHGFLNVHPSLLPRLRGASPIRFAILNDEKETGVTIMLLDEQMDHGPIIAQKKISVAPWPPHLIELERSLMTEGGKLLAQILPHFVADELEAKEQNHDVATHCGKIEKEDGLLDLNDDAYKNLLKIRAFEGWPGTFAYFVRGGKKIRAKILDGHLEGKQLIIEHVVPEGKREMTYEEFVRSGAKHV